MAASFVPSTALRLTSAPPGSQTSFTCRRTTRRAVVSSQTSMKLGIDVAQTPVPIDGTGLPAPKSYESASQSLASFHEYFACMSGTWNSERTYHYQLPTVAREESQTTFDVKRLQPSEVTKVLESNGDTTALLSTEQKQNTQGFNVSFLTRMESQSELVRSSTNLAFVPNSILPNGIVLGDYYRDLGYEETAPVKASFSFDCAKMELTMTTFYTRVVSVDQISLINLGTRLRRIVNYVRPPAGKPITVVALVGFGIERKSLQRLVS